MTQPPNAEEPNLIEPSGLNYRLIAGLVAGLLIVGAIVSIPLFQHWQEEQSCHVERGLMQGAVYPITVEGQPYAMELGWPGPHLGVRTEPALPEDATVTVKGRFGEETLAWNPEGQFFGPTQAQLDPFSHYKVSVTVAENGQTLWSGKCWAWGVHSEGHHHH